MKLKELFKDVEKKYLDADIVWYAHTPIKIVGAIILDNRYHVVLKMLKIRPGGPVIFEKTNAKEIKRLNGIWYGHTHNMKRLDDIWYEDKEQMNEVNEQMIVESI